MHVYVYVYFVKDKLFSVNYDMIFFLNYDTIITIYSL